MNYKNKLELKKTLCYLAGLLIILLILTISYFYNKVVEMILTITYFYLFKNLWDKQYHSPTSLIHCGIISIIVFGIIARIELPLTTSIFSVIIISFIVTMISYYIKDYIDKNIYIKELKSYKYKGIKSMELDYMIEIMPNIDKEILEIVYGYFHKPITMTSDIYAYKKNIGKTTLFRYINIVKKAYEELDKKI